MKPLLRLATIASLMAGCFAAAPANAMSMAEAMSTCKEQMTPLVRECVRSKMGGQRGDPSQYIPGCRASIMGQAKACVARLIGAAGLKDNPLEAARTPASHIAVNVNKRAVPPRTIADITAILDQEKPDPVRLKKLQTAADASNPGSDNSVSGSHFYYGRALVRAEIGRFREAMVDAQKAVDIATGKVDQYVLSVYRLMLAIQQASTGDPKRAIQTLQKIAEDGERSSQKGFLFTVYRQIALNEVALGNFDRAQSYVQKLQALAKSASSIRGYDSHANSWLGNVEEAKGRLAEVQGRLEEAATLYQKAEQMRRGNIEKSANAVIPVPRSQIEQASDMILLASAQVKSRMGRFAEGESDMRRALLNRLKATGKFHPQAARFIAAFGSLLIEQGRFEEARKLLVTAIDIYRQLGIPEDSQVLVLTSAALASVQALEGHWQNASETNAAIERATKDWEPARRENVILTHGYIETLFKMGKADASLAAAKRLLELKQARYGDRHPDTMLARGQYAVALARTGRDADALREFEASVPALTAVSFETDNDDVVNAAARTRFTQVVVENYIGLLGRTPQAPGFNVAIETFRLADSVRSRSVQKALTAAGARMTTSDPRLAEAVRHEQDLRQQIGTQLGQLNALLALPAAERDDSGVASIRKSIEKMRADHTKVRADIDKRFPEYSDLIDPKPPTTAQIKDILKPGESLLSFYFGHEASFVWAIAQDGKVEFATLREGAASIESKIKKLREALEPQAAMISDIPKFDLALSHQLYKTLLEPVKAGWLGSKNLVVVTNGALGLLPLGLLTVAPSELKEDGPLFSGYRSVPWLARTHAVTVVPSASALRTLRRLPPGSDKREKLIAFGDPWFNPKQAGEASQGEVKLAAADSQMRGVPLRRRAGPPEGSDSAGIGELPRLPDTADELRSIALALQADPTKALHLGKDANEQLVKKTDLSGFKIVAFATHGLVPGELDGLDQPALALSAPDVAGVEGDGLLTMHEILSLKLDADWVVLSACNTGAGAGAGAEAASGLGRAFFYAGTRAILVTNWSVHSQSARELVTDLFRRQSNDAKLTRGEALRQASMALLDGKGYTDEKGETLFAYAHPLFWAPYTIIGDGG